MRFAGVDDGKRRLQEVDKRPNANLGRLNARSIKVNRVPAGCVCGRIVVLPVVPNEQELM